MRRLRSYGEDLASVGEKDLDRTFSLSSSHCRRLYTRKPPENGRNRPGIEYDRDRDVLRGSRKRIDHDLDGSDDREGSRSMRKRVEYDFGDNFAERETSSCMRKRLDHDLDGFDNREGSRSLRKKVDRDILDDLDERAGFRGMRKRLDHDNDGSDKRKAFDRYWDKDRGDRGGFGFSLVSPRGGYAGLRDRDRERDRDKERDRERMHRSESFCMSRREFPKGFRSERDRTRRKDGMSSWRRFGSSSSSRSKKDGEDEVKSSAGERAGSSSSRGGWADGSSSRESLRSPRRVKDVKSTTWSGDSRDSEGETSRSAKKVEITVAESTVAESMVGESTKSGSGSEMEEGELQPEPHQPDSSHEPEPKSDTEHGMEHFSEQENQVRGDIDAENKREVSTSCPGNDSRMDESATNVNLALQEEKREPNKEDGCEQKLLGGEVSEKNEAVHETEKLSECEIRSVDKSPGSEEIKASEVPGNRDEAANDESLRGDHSESSAPKTSRLDSDEKEKGTDDKYSAKSLLGDKLEKGIDLEVGPGDIKVTESSNAAVEESVKEAESCVPVLKDKGKGVAVCSPEEDNFRGHDALIERNFISSRDDAMEGSSTRGFELFSCSVGMKSKHSGVSKRENEKIKLEPLDLSLALPNVSLPVASTSAAPRPSSPPRAKSVQSLAASFRSAPHPSSPPQARSVQSLATSFRTGSDAFTTSISFSGSQFIHNPSCSLTRNSIDFDLEQSVKSRPLFQGVDWQALSMNGTSQQEILTGHKILPNGNGSLHLSHASDGMLNCGAMQGEGAPSGLDRSVSLQRQLSGLKARYQDDLRSPTQSSGSHDGRSEYGKDKKRVVGEDSGSRLFRSSSQREMDQGPAVEGDLIEKLIYLIVSEPVQAISWRIQGMAERLVACLKQRVCDITGKQDKRGKLQVLQQVLQERSDLNLETLLKSHRVQLEILVAVKTGLPDFLQRAGNASSTDLAQIFLNMKCRNLSCQSVLPVDECDCKFCSPRNGFCSFCMCLICSKFDMASNTCSWVGCDACGHWCHTECGLRKRYIRNGHSVSASQGKSEMQFYCLACDHPSEMFGFVKDVFKSCAAEWKAETMLKELDYARMIFSATSDARGKSLYDTAKQMIARLQTGSNVKEVYNQIMSFLNESDSKFENALEPTRRELQPHDRNKGDAINGVAALSQEPSWLKSVPMKTAPSRTENVGVTLPSTDTNSIGRTKWDYDMRVGPSKGPVADELGSIIKMKLAEAEMFQNRAVDAKREAQRLKRAAIAKNEKMEEEYASRVQKLRLGEAKERQRRMLEELQALERSHREYFNMKVRMEADIKDLLLKMEATRRNLGT